MLHLSAVKAEVACCLTLLVTRFASHEGFQRKMEVWAEFGPLFFPRHFQGAAFGAASLEISSWSTLAHGLDAYGSLKMVVIIPKMNACDTSDQIRVPFRTQF